MTRFLVTVILKVYFKIVVQPKSFDKAIEMYNIGFLCGLLHFVFMISSNIFKVSRKNINYF